MNVRRAKLVSVVAALGLIAALGATCETVGPTLTGDYVKTDDSAALNLVLVETSTKSKGATTITWDSSFADFDYVLGDQIDMTVNWTVDAGAADYDSFVFKKTTPKSKKDPGEGSMGDVTWPGANGATSVDVAFTFSGLHLDRRRDVDIGNGHFKLYLMVDKDGDGTPESRAGFGVNLHVEDPQ